MVFADLNAYHSQFLISILCDEESEGICGFCPHSSDLHLKYKCASVVSSTRHTVSPCMFCVYFLYCVYLCSGYIRVYPISYAYM